MSQVELDYYELKQEIVEEIKKRSVKVLATSCEDLVTARQVRFSSDGLTMVCFTDLNSRKYQQMIANPNVTICDEGLQIEGEASLKGHPLDKENAIYLKIFREQHPDIYMKTGLRDIIRTQILGQ